MRIGATSSVAQRSRSTPGLGARAQRQGSTLGFYAWVLRLGSTLGFYAWVLRLGSTPGLNTRAQRRCSMPFLSAIALACSTAPFDPSLHSTTNIARRERLPKSKGRAHRYPPRASSGHGQLLVHCPNLVNRSNFVHGPTNPQRDLPHRALPIRRSSFRRRALPIRRSSFRRRVSEHQRMPRWTSMLEAGLSWRRGAPGGAWGARSSANEMPPRPVDRRRPGTKSGGSG
jgi:hypothetical protein